MMADWRIDMYILAKKIKSKWYGVAGVDLGPQSCLAQADKYFCEQGFPSQWKHPDYKVSWGCIEKQKNYGGRTPIFQML
jgi:hypothetical protein